jgi:DNA (cytosine-5)-methyltransferase 1
MAKAGAMVIEWALLDAQHFGIPQRRRRVFCIAIFNPATASLCPSPLLPVSESLPGHLAKGKQKRKSAATTLTESTGTDGRIVNAIGASIYHKQTVVNQDVNSGHLIVGALAARDYKGVGNQYVAENKCVVEPMLSFDTQFGSNANVTEDVAPTLKASQQSPSVAYPIDTRNALRDPEKYDAQNRQGLGIGADGDPMATLTPAHVNAVAFDEFNHSVHKTHHSLRTIGISTGVLLGSEVAATLRSGGDGGVPSSRGEHLVTEPTMAVRRLTPLECERLMGWPDDHTRYKADGTEQADTHRYKQCGNTVTVYVRLSEPPTCANKHQPTTMEKK